MASKDVGKNKITLEKELQLVRESVDELQHLSKKKMANSPTVKKMVAILEQFLRKKKLVCYGGTALNNILPPKDQFYDKNLDIPDYDFYSSSALEDSKELADIYAKSGYDSVEARAGAHYGTFKVVVQFIPIADITQMDEALFKNLVKESIKIDNILYAPVNFLRLGIYKELSRPDGDISRWEKVYARLNLLNKNYPIKDPKCDVVNFMRDFEGNPENEKTLYTSVKNSIIKQGLVFIGGYASSLYKKYLPIKEEKILNSIPDFDALSENPKKSALQIKRDLEKSGFTKVKIVQKPGIGEVIAPHYEVAVDKDTICFIYEPLGCHSYNTITIKNKVVKIATIDTMLNLYLAFLYIDKPHYDHNRILCMSDYLFNVQAKNKLNQKGILKRFAKECYGTETTIDSIRMNKAKKYKELKHDRNSREYMEYFMKYDPSTKNKTKKLHPNKSNTRKKSITSRLLNFLK